MEKKKKENPLISLIFSIIIPAIILSKFSSPDRLGVLPGVLIALAFPISFAIYNLIVTKKAGFIAILGFVSIFLTGIINEEKLSKHLGERASVKALCD